MAKHARSQGASQTNTQPMPNGQAAPVYRNSNASNASNTAPFARVSAASASAAATQPTRPANADAPYSDYADYAGSAPAYPNSAAYQQASYETLRSGAAQAAGRKSKGRAKGRKRKPGCLVRLLQLVLALLLLALLALGGYVFALNSRLAIEGPERSEVINQLTDRLAGEPYYMLVLGSDSREGTGTSDKESESGDNERSDIMILLRIDERNDVVTMLSIPRDTPYRLADGRVVRINEAYNIGGASESIKAVSQLTGANISHYAEVRMSGFEALVDALGGVDVDVPQEISVYDTLTGDPITVYPGYQTLSGKQAQAVVRARHEYEEGEVMRQRMVREVVTALMKSVIDRPVREIPGAALQVASYVGTDMNVLNLVPLASTFALNKADLVVYSGSGPTAGDWRSDLDDQWFCYDNPEGWQAVMAVVDAGGDPSTVDANAYAIIP